MIKPRVSVESARGCGYRKVGGMYLVGKGLAAPCPLLPLPLHVCPVCGQGIKPSRGWTWVSPAELFRAVVCPDGCPVLQNRTEPCPWKVAAKAGLLWVGEKFYATAAEFEQEAAVLGVSRRISSLPRAFRLGETWVLLAHRKAIPVGQPDGNFVGVPGLFRAWLPERVEKVVTEDAPQEDLEALLARGIEPVVVLRDQEQTDLAAGKRHRTKRKQRSSG